MQRRDFLDRLFRGLDGSRDRSFLDFNSDAALAQIERRGVTVAISVLESVAVPVAVPFRRGPAIGTRAATPLSFSRTSAAAGRLPARRCRRKSRPPCGRRAGSWRSARRAPR